MAPGRFVSHTDAGGIQTTVAAETLGRIDELQRSFTVGGTTTLQSLLYAYIASGPASAISQAEITGLTMAPMEWATRRGSRPNSTPTRSAAAQS